MNNFNQLWQQAHLSYSSHNWSSLLQALQQLILDTDRQDSDVATHRGELLELAIAVLKFGDFQQRWDIAKVLPRLGTICITPLVAILEDEEAEDELCWYAVRILGEFHHPDAVTALVTVLQQSDNEELSAMAVTALGQIGQSAIAPLTALLTTPDTKLLAVQTLAYIRTSETITPLLSVVNDTDATVRATTLEALSSFHDPRVLLVLVKALDDIAPVVRQEAVKGIGVRFDLYSELDLETRLSARLYDFNIDVCCAAAVALSRMGTDAAAAHLFKVLISPHTPLKLQIEIIRALSWVGTESSLEYLQQALSLDSVPVWQEVVTVIGRLTQPDLTIKATEILISLLHSQHPATQQPRITQAIALSLGQLGENSAIAPLISLLANSDTAVRLHAIAALKNLAPEAAHLQLQNLATDVALTPALQQGIAIALAEW